MLGHFAISQAPISGLGVSVTLKLGASSVLASVTTSNAASKTVFTASANSTHLTTSQIARAVKEVHEGLVINSKAETSIIGLRKGVSSVLSQGSATNTVSTQKIAITSSANSASATTTQTSKRLREAASQNSGNVITNTVSSRIGITSIHVDSLANITSIPLRISQLEIGLSSSVNLDNISDILWEALDKEVGNPSNITYTDLSAGSSATWNELENP